MGLRGKVACMPDQIQAQHGFSWPFPMPACDFVSLRTIGARCG